MPHLGSWEPRSRALIRGFAGLGAIGISFSAVLVRVANVSPSTASFFRSAYALPVLALLWAATRSADTRTRRMRWRAFVAGAFLGVDLALWHRAIAEIGAGLATVLANVQVVFVGALAWWIHRERPSRASMILVPTILAGVVLTTGLGYAGAYGRDPIAGVVFGASAGAAYSAFLLLFRASNPVLAPPTGPLLDATCGTAAAALVTGLSEPNFSLAVSWPSHGWLVVLALGAHTVGWLCIAMSLPRLAALETSVLLLLQPVFTMIWALAFFGEVPSAVQLAGAAIVLGGITALSIFGSVARQVRHPAPP